LEINGYCKIPQLYTPEDTGKALELISEWHEKSNRSLSRNVPFLNRNQPMVYNLQNKDFYFLQLVFAPQELQAILIYFLNDIWYKPIPRTKPNYILRSYLARSSNDALPLHIDSFVPYIGDYVFSMQVAIVLEDQNEASGCTAIVPGSHKYGQYAEQDSLKDAVPIKSRAGDVIIWDSRVWHGALPNRSGKTRWALIATFSRWWLKQAFSITRNLPQEIYEKLTDSQKAILGFCSIPYNNESEGIDMKRGYDSLLADVSRY
jgi:Phytanoyl-CoA dioxygenase (PhyH)